MTPLLTHVLHWAYTCGRATRELCDAIAAVVLVRRFGKQRTDQRIEGNKSHFFVGNSSRGSMMVGFVIGGVVMDRRGTWSFVSLLLLATTAWGAPREVCYPPVGCFSMTSPWYTWLRPLPTPQPADVINTRIVVFDRQHRDGQGVETRPDIRLPDGAFDASRRTFLLTHGFTHDGNESWVRDLKDALLDKVDGNVFVVDWGKGAGQLDYLLVASNTRVVAAEVIRLAKHLVAEHDADVDGWHLIGHSLGAHIISYVAKATPGVGRLTALDPAQPAFELFDRRVRLDVSDAALVDVVHTSARPFLPFAGLGMVAAHGHLDFYMNGGAEQPGCGWTAPTWRDLGAGVRVEELMDVVGCPHQRSYEYFTESIRGSCVFWGRRPEDVARRRECDADRCSPLGLDAADFPARGVFHVATGAATPFCVPDVAADEAMERFRLRPDVPEEVAADVDEAEVPKASRSFATLVFGTNRSHELSLSPDKIFFRFRW